MQKLPEGFDLAVLLAPISREAPAGTDLREDDSPDSLYHRLRDARGEAREAERAADAPRSEGDASPVAPGPPIAPLAKWRTVYELSSEALRAYTKDLEIAAWLTEALLRSHGLNGLAAGCRLMAGLADGIWDELFPQPDEDGIATRVAPVAGLNGVGREGTLMQPLRRLVLFHRPQNEAPFEFWQYQHSLEVAGIADTATRQQRLDRGVLPFDVVETEAREAERKAREGGISLFALLRAQAAEAADAWQALGEILDVRAGSDAPPTSQVRDLLEQIQSVAKRYETEAEASETASPQLAELGNDLPLAAGGAQGGLASREDALRVLAQIADFFRRTEPHSPLAYTLHEAVRRGRMTWPELLAEIVPDATSRSAILSSLGILPPPSK